MPDRALETWRQWAAVAERHLGSKRRVSLRGGHAGRDLGGNQSWGHIRILPITPDVSPSGLTGLQTHLRVILSPLARMVSIHSTPHDLQCVAMAGVRNVRCRAG